MKIGKLFLFLFLLALLLYAAVLELSKNTLWGWALMVILFGGFLWVHNTLLSGVSIWLRLLGWAVLLLLLAVNLKLTEPPYRAVSAVEGKNPAATGVVEVAQGKLTGVYTEDSRVEVYTGIPYAKPPVGELRWKEPQAPEAWDGIRVCDHFAPMSMQQRSPEIFNSLVDLLVYRNYKISLKDNYRSPVSEDSLYLNIWKPAGDITGAPVLVFVHGGSLTTGQTWYSEYNGEALARRGIVVVNFAYRLNVFGYYANEELAAESPNGTTGNYGLLDQVAALKWVRENIAAFGGDPDNVTLAGESAGSSSVNALCVSPLSAGLFRRAIGESSSVTAVEPYHTFRPLTVALEMGRNILSEFGAEHVADLRQVPAEKLVGTRYTNSAMTVDGYALTEQPYLTYARGGNHEEALLNGFNAQEAVVFAFFYRVTEENLAEQLRPLFGDYAGEAAAVLPIEGVDPNYRYPVDRGGGAKGTFHKLLTAAWFSYSHYDWSRLVAAEGRPVYEYYFTKHNRTLAANHGGEMPYAYGNLDKHASRYDDSDEALSQLMLDYWENFIRTGDPNGESLPLWEPVTGDSSRVLELGEQVEMTDDPFLPVYAVIDKYQDTKR